MSTRGVEAFTHRFIPTHTADTLTLLLLHGTGGDENDLLELGRALDGQAALLSPRGQVNERGANRWFRRLAEGVFDTDDLLARTDQLANFITSAAAHYRLDASRLVAVGFSNGANIAATLLLRHP
jgi:predicted esterase